MNRVLTKDALEELPLVHMIGLFMLWEGLVVGCNVFPPSRVCISVHFATPHVL
jgi:hypothetical protein